MDKPCHTLEGKVYCIDRGCRLPVRRYPVQALRAITITRTAHGHRNSSEPESPARPDQSRRGVSLLAQARLRQLRRPDRADRDHAPGPGRAEALDLGEALPARTQLLHGAAGP